MIRAAVLKETGGTPEVGEFREPEAESGATVVDVSVAGLNPVDLVIAKGLMPARLKDLPAVVGLEGVGTTPDGTRVYFDVPVAPFGSIAEKALVEDGSIVPVPDGVEDGPAVAFGIAGMAAWLGLEWRARLQEGETVLVLGSSGVLGQIAVQSAKLLGAGKVIAASRKEEDLEKSRTLGADEVVVLGGADLEDRFKEAAGGGGIDVILDPLWGEPAIAALGAIAMHGRLVQIGNSAGPSADLVTRGFRNQLASILGHTNFNAPQEVKADAFQKMCGHAADGNLTIDVETVALEDIADAWSRQTDGPPTKLVIRP